MIALAGGLIFAKFHPLTSPSATPSRVETSDAPDASLVASSPGESSDRESAPLDPEAHEVIIDPPTFGDIIDLHKCIVDVELWSRGERYTENVAVEIWRSEDDAARADAPNTEPRQLGRQHTTNGVANFINVEPGISITGRAEVDHVVYRSDEAHPVMTREQSRVVVRIEIPSIPRFRARLLAENGLALPHRALRVQRFERKGNGTTRALLDDRAATDALGFVEVGFPLPEVLAASYRLRFESGSGREKVCASVDLKPPLTPGTHDLSDLVMRPPKRIAAGKVVDARGEPIDQATVTLSRAGLEESIGSPPTIEATVITDKAGAFEIFGFEDDADFQLVASHGDYGTSAPVPCRGTAFDVAIELVKESKR